MIFQYFSYFFTMFEGEGPLRDLASHILKPRSMPINVLQELLNQKVTEVKTMLSDQASTLESLGTGDTRGTRVERSNWLAGFQEAASSKLSKTAEIRAWRQGLEWLEWVRRCTKPNFLTLLSQSVSCRCLIFSLRQVVPSFEMPLMEISKRLEVESTHVHSVG